MKQPDFRPLPEFLCIGAQKAATSWLWAMLRQHPKVWMPPVKELHFFDHIHIPENRAWTHYHIKKGVNEALKWHHENKTNNLEHMKYLIDTAMVDPFTEKWYRACFNRGGAKGKVKGDITPEYSTLPDEGVRHVKTLLGPEVKLIYILRDPVQRALSQLKMNLTRRSQENEGDDFWLEAAKDPVITQRGDYRTYVPRWETVFPKANLLYIPYGLAKKDPADFLRKVEDHIGVPRHADYSGMSKPIHKTREATVPDKAVDYLREILEPQTAFLRSHFGKEFADLT